jgi:hypothetical protein
MVGDKDVTDILRGKIQILDDILQVKDSFEKFDMLEKTVRDEEKKVKGA